MFIGQYEVISQLGEGGMGKVMLAKSSEGRLVVIKQPFEGNAEFRDLLVNEARVGLRLKHPHIVDTVDFFELDGQVSLVLSYVSGASLQAIREKGPVPPGVVCLWGRQIAEALEVIHTATNEEGVPLNIVHRDVTPGNLMMGHDGNARLIDLGIARSDDRQLEHTRTGYLRGTLRYLAPEVFESGTYTPASDIWALGMSLLDAALGRPAIEGREAEVYAKVMSGRVIDKKHSEELHPALEKALRKLLAQDPAERPQRAKHVAALFSMLGMELSANAQQAARVVRAAVGEQAPALTNPDEVAPTSDELVEQAVGAWGGSAQWVAAHGEAARPMAERSATPATGTAAPGGDDADKTELLDVEEVRAQLKSNPFNRSVGTKPKAPIEDDAKLDATDETRAPERPQVPATNNAPSRSELEKLDQHRPPTQGGSAGPTQGGQTQLRSYMSDLRAMEKGSSPRARAMSNEDEKKENMQLILTAVVAGGLVLACLLVVGVVLLVSNLTDEPLPEKVVVTAVQDAGAPAVVDAPEPASEPEGPTPEELEEQRLAAEKRAEEEKRMKALRARMPSCWQPGVTKYFYYKVRGRTYIKQKYKDVPKKYKSRVKCSN